MNTKKLFIIAGALLLLSTLAFPAENSTKPWDSIPGNFSGALHGMRSPEGAKHMFIAGDMGITFRSEDSGQSWHPANSGPAFPATHANPVIALGGPPSGTSGRGAATAAVVGAIDPTAASEFLISAGGAHLSNAPWRMLRMSHGGAFYSEDSGLHWWPLQPDCAGAMTVAFQAGAIDPVFPDRVVLATGDAQSADGFPSSSGGRAHLGTLSYTDSDADLWGSARLIEASGCPQLDTQPCRIRAVAASTSIGFDRGRATSDHCLQTTSHPWSYTNLSRFRVGIGKLLNGQELCQALPTDLPPPGLTTAGGDYFAYDTECVTTKHASHGTVFQAGLSVDAEYRCIATAGDQYTSQPPGCTCTSNTDCRYPRIDFVHIDPRNGWVYASTPVGLLLSQSSATPTPEDYARQWNTAPNLFVAMDDGSKVDLNDPAHRGWIDHVGAISANWLFVPGQDAAADAELARRRHHIYLPGASGPRPHDGRMVAFVSVSYRVPPAPGQSATVRRSAVFRAISPNESTPFAFHALPCAYSAAAGGPQQCDSAYPELAPVPGVTAAAIEGDAAAGLGGPLPHGGQYSYDACTSPGTRDSGCLNAWTQVQVAPSDPRIVYALADPIALQGRFDGPYTSGCKILSGLYRSLDGGAHWKLVFNHLLPQGFASAGDPTTPGLGERDIHDLHVDPDNPYLVGAASVGDWPYYEDAYQIAPGPACWDPEGPTNGDSVAIAAKTLPGAHVLKLKYTPVSSSPPSDAEYWAAGTMCSPGTLAMYGASCLKDCAFAKLCPDVPAPPPCTPNGPSWTTDSLAPPPYCAHHFPVLDNSVAGAESAAVPVSYLCTPCADVHVGPFSGQDSAAYVAAPLTSGGGTTPPPDCCMVARNMHMLRPVYGEGGTAAWPPAGLQTLPTTPATVPSASATYTIARQTGANEAVTYDVIELLKGQFRLVMGKDATLQLGTASSISSGKSADGKFVPKVAVSYPGTGPVAPPNSAMSAIRSASQPDVAWMTGRQSAPRVPLTDSSRRLQAVLFKAEASQSVDPSQPLGVAALTTAVATIWAPGPGAAFTQHDVSIAGPDGWRTGYEAYEHLLASSGNRPLTLALHRIVPGPNVPPANQGSTTDSVIVAIRGAGIFWVRPGLNMGPSQQEYPAIPTLVDDATYAPGSVLPPAVRVLMSRFTPLEALPPPSTPNLPPVPGPYRPGPLVRGVAFAAPNYVFATVGQPEPPSGPVDDSLYLRTKRPGIYFATLPAVDNDNDSANVEPTWTRLDGPSWPTIGGLATVLDEQTGKFRFYAAVLPGMTGMYYNGGECQQGAYAVECDDSPQSSPPNSPICVHYRWRQLSSIENITDIALDPGRTDSVIVTRNASAGVRPGVLQWNDTSGRLWCGNTSCSAGMCAVAPGGLLTSEYGGQSPQATPSASGSVFLLTDRPHAVNPPGRVAWSSTMTTTDKTANQLKLACANVFEQAAADRTIQCRSSQHTVDASAAVPGSAAGVCIDLGQVGQARGISAAHGEIVHPVVLSPNLVGGRLAVATAGAGAYVRFHTIFDGPYAFQLPNIQYTDASGGGSGGGGNSGGNSGGNGGCTGCSQFNTQTPPADWRISKAVLAVRYTATGDGFDRNSALTLGGTALACPDDAPGACVPRTADRSAESLFDVPTDVLRSDVGSSSRTLGLAFTGTLAGTAIEDVHLQWHSDALLGTTTTFQEGQSGNWTLTPPSSVSTDVRWADARLDTATRVRLRAQVCGPAAQVRAVLGGHVLAEANHDQAGACQTLDFVGTSPAMPFGATNVRVETLQGGFAPWHPLELAYAQGTVIRGTGTVPASGGVTGYDQPYMLSDPNRTLLIFDHDDVWSWDLRINATTSVSPDAASMTTATMANGSHRTAIWSSAAPNYGPNVIELVPRSGTAPTGQVWLQAAVLEVDANPSRRW